MSSPKVITCKIPTKKHNANAFLSYFSAFLTILLVVSLVGSIITFFDFAGHIWRAILLATIIILFVFSQIVQWELYPTLQRNESGKVEYFYSEALGSWGNNKVTYEFVEVTRIRYGESITLYGTFKCKAPLRKAKTVHKCKLQRSSEEVEDFLTKYVKVVKK